MEFQSPRPRLTRSVRNTTKLKTEYKNSLQFYTIPPNEVISLQEFEEFAIDRLKVLRAIERINLGRTARFSDDWKLALKNDLNKQNLRSYYQLSSSIQDEDQIELMVDARRKDHISHFLLRLAFCRTEESRRWFISQESDLFRFRFSEEKSETIQRFMQENQINFHPIQEEEKKKILLKLMNTSSHPSRVDNTEYYKVPFTDALDLVRQRKVYLQAGFAYIPADELVSIITASFRSHLSLAMTLTMRSLPELEDDHRIKRLLSDLDKRYTGQDFNSSQNKKTAGSVTPDMLDGLSKQSFAPCMRHLHETMRATHHLKHGGRIQYGLFIKGIGLSLEHSLKFWRDEFSKHMDIDKFEKQYAYTIRHNYGKEGKRVNYTPHSCIKIINSSIGPGENHGCPFKHFDPALLRQKLTLYRVAPTVVQDIADLVSRQHYQIACQRYFEATHQTELDGGIQHPNQYFQESQKILNGDVKERSLAKGSHKVPTTRATLTVKEKPAVVDEMGSDDDYNYSTLDL